MRQRAVKTGACDIWPEAEGRSEEGHSRGVVFSRGGGGKTPLSLSLSRLFPQTRHFPSHKTVGIKSQPEVEQMFCDFFRAPK